MRVLQIFLSIISIWSFVSAGRNVGLNRDSSDVVLTTDLGKVRGTFLTSSSGRRFHAFRGIRYTQPPVGELRFKDPVPVEPWTEIFDATTDGPMCPQPTDDISDLSEDCLRINVYSHVLPSRHSPNVRRPVVVFLYPGGMYAGSGQSKNFAAPGYLMNRDIVLVTLNYRLGSLGFFSTGTAEAPGNQGFKDQVIALRWIKRHIARFGGDPDSVTLLGYSSGALSITLHMMSPMSRGLFHKAIVQSFSGVAQWEVPSNQIRLVRRQARLVNCTDQNIKEMIDCLRSKNYIEFVNTLTSMFDFGDGNLGLLWNPVVEPDFGQERFITEDPVKAYQEGRFMKIPVIAGMVKDEFLGTAMEVLANDSVREIMDNNFDEVAPICFLYERNTPRSKEISAQLRRAYVPESPLTYNKSVEGLGHLFSDGLVGFGVHRFVHLAARLTKVYYYRFSYQGRFSFLYPNIKPFGVVHGDDLLYLFSIPAPYTQQDPEYQIMERMTRIVEAFAYKGDPNNRNDEFLRRIRWKPFCFRKESYLDIGDEAIMKQGLYADRFAVWERLFPLNWNIQGHQQEHTNCPNHNYPLNEEYVDHYEDLTP